MFDPYFQMSAHARKEAFLHSRRFRTWQDNVRENRDTDVNSELGNSFSESLLRSLLGLYKPILGLTIVVIVVILVILASSACTPPQSQPTIDPISTQANIPNPASVYCEAQGNKLEIRTAADGSQSGVCIFADGSECDEWAYFRGECGPTSQSTTDSAPTAIPTAMPIDPADYQQGWWTYKHPAYGFSIMLPEDWVVEEITTFDPLMSGHSLYLHPNYDDKQSIHMAFRRVGEDARLWPTGVGQGEFIQQGTLDIAGLPAQRLLLVCPTGEVTAIWYHGSEEGQPNITRGDMEFGFIYSIGSHCDPGLSIGGKTQRWGEMIIASLKVP
jgi:putative hemolysin